MPVSIQAHLAMTPDSTSLESLAILADRAFVLENDVKESTVGVAEIRLNEWTDVCRPASVWARTTSRNVVITLLLQGDYLHHHHDY